MNAKKKKKNEKIALSAIDVNKNYVGLPYISNFKIPLFLKINFNHISCNLKWFNQLKEFEI